jgi:glutamate/tyrosine decarboxylase-like PLP-dependent enzyme
MDVDALSKRLKCGDVGTVVVTMGATATGSVDALPDILALRDTYGFRVLGKLYKHDSPYTYFSSSELHLGEISLECSRPGAAAAALWATQKLLPLEKGGDFAQGLERCRKAALRLHDQLQQDTQFLAAFSPELDIVVWVPRGEGVGEISARSRAIFAAAASRGLHLALAELPVKFFQGLSFGRPAAQQTVTALRSVLMKPEHLDWMDRIWVILQAAAAERGKNVAKQV